VSRSLKAHILLVLMTACWGATFVMIKDALADISPVLFNTARMVLAAVALLLIFHKDLVKLTRKALGAGALVGVFLWAGFAFQTTGLKLTTPSKSAFLTGLSVVLVPVFLAIGWRRMINRWSAVGVGAAFFGLYLLTVPAANGNGFNLSSINHGDLLTLGCAIAFGLQIVAMGRAIEQHPFRQIAVLQVVVTAVLMLLSVPSAGTGYAIWSPRVISAIAVTGLVNTALAFTVQAWAQQFTPPTHTALIFSLEPVFAWITSYLVLHERLGIRAGVGAILILAGVLTSELLGANRSTGPAVEFLDFTRRKRSES
jgi:drug/metabolite transporter (DMT)-like permease